MSAFACCAKLRSHEVLRSIMVECRRKAHELTPQSLRRTAPGGRRLIQRSQSFSRINPVTF